MQINWPQLVTNVLGFLLLYWGLRRFAWGPILGLLDARREKIAKGFEKVERDLAKAQQKQEALDSQLRDVESTARKRIEEAVAEGNRVAGEIRDEARQEARALLEKAKSDIERERAKARVELRDEIVSMAVTGAEKILRERLAGDGQRQLVNRFIDEIEDARA